MWFVVVVVGTMTMRSSDWFDRWLILVGTCGVILVGTMRCEMDWYSVRMDGTRANQSGRYLMNREVSSAKRSYASPPGEHRLAGSRPIKCSFFSAASDASMPTVWITLIVKKCLQRSVGFSTIYSANFLGEADRHVAFLRCRRLSSVYIDIIF